MPFSSAYTGFGTPKLRNVCAPRMLRVRPAQFTTILVFGFGHDPADAIGELAVRAADAGRNAHLRVLGPRPAVQHHDIVAALEHRIELGDADARRVVGVLDQLAERLARQIDALVDLITGRRPGPRAAGEQVQIRITHRSEPTDGARGQRIVAFVVDDDARARARNQTPDHELEPAVRNRGREEQMAFAELTRLHGRRAARALRHPAATASASWRRSMGSWSRCFHATVSARVSSLIALDERV